MIDIELIKVDESFVKIKCEMSILLELREKFTFQVDGYRFTPAYKYGTWDGNICMIKKNEIPLGLVGEVCKVADQYGYSVELDPRLIPSKYFAKISDFDTWLDQHPVYNKGEVITPFWYQQDSIYYGINNKRCILNLPTGAGKSLVQGYLTKWYMETFDKNVLLLVPTVALTDQMQNDLVNYGLLGYDDINIVRGGSTDVPNARLTIGTWQSIIKRGRDFMSQFGMLLCDECHLSTGKSITDIVNNLTNCEYKIGLTGSLKDGKANMFTYMGLFGSNFSPVTTKQLADGGFIADLDINMIYMQYNQDICKAMHKIQYVDEIKYIVNNESRLHFVTSLASKLTKGGSENVLVLFKQIAHGKLIYDSLCTLIGEDNVEFIDGSVSRENRTNISKTTEDATGRVIVASYGTTSTGISINKLHHVILSHPVKSKITVVQSIGRLLRKHKTKQKAKIWDLVDSFVMKKRDGSDSSQYNYTLNHGLSRMQLYIESEFNYITKRIDLK